MGDLICIIWCLVHIMGGLIQQFNISLILKTVTEHNEDDEVTFSDVVQQDAHRKKRLSKYMSQLYFLSKYIELANDSIYNYDANMIKYNEKNRKFLPTDKCNFSHSFPKFKLLSMNACWPLWNVALKQDKRNFQEDVRIPISY